MTLRTYNAKSAQLSYFFLLCLTQILEILVKLVEKLSCLQKLRIICCHKACCKGNGFTVIAPLCHFSLGFKLRVSAKDNICTSAGHIGCYCNHIISSGFCYYLGFLVVLLYALGSDVSGADIWAIADLTTGVPAFINLVVIIFLSGKFFQPLKDYRARYLGRGQVDPNFKLFDEDVQAAKSAAPKN